MPVLASLPAAQFRHSPHPLSNSLHTNSLMGETRLNSLLCDLPKRLRDNYCLEGMMKLCFDRLWKAGRGVIFGAMICLSAGGAAFSQSSAQDAVPVLEGLDPVMLVQGKEVQGDARITSTRGQFQYMFANVENRSAFEKDPQRYEIQL